MNIDKQALEETKRVCHEELNQIGCKYNTNHLEIMYLFLKKELRFLLIFSLIGVIFIFMISNINIDTALSTFIIYVGLIGGFAIGEYIKADYYHTKDLLKMGYINMGKSFLYTCILFMVIEIMNFSIIYLLLPLSYQHIIMIILCSLFPMFFSQIISICFMKYITNIFSAIIVYFITYVGISLFFLISNRYAMINLQTCIVLVISSIILYSFIIFITYKQRKVESPTWN